MKAITLRDVRKTYSTARGRHAILNGVDLTIRAGEKIGILGRNGAGKSTLIRLISGAELPTSGDIRRGMKVSWPLAFSGGFQGSLTGADNIRFLCRVYGVPIAPVLDYVEEFAQLGAFMHEPVRTYSSGMRARLGFAATMAIEFDCFLIDEVIAVGDATFHERCRRELFERRHDRALLIVSHDERQIRDHCQRVVVLQSGRLHHFDSTDEAYDFHHRH